MENLFAARAQMAISLAFHIVFAVVGMAMPLLMAIAEWMHLRTADPTYLALAKRWARGTAILFAVGAVSGTVLSFELGLLWPAFMERAGPVIGMPFSMEGFAFFLEAIFIGVYLYGWDRISPRAHLASGAVVAVSGLASGVFVVAVNAWMNTPSGITVDAAGRITAVDLRDAFFSPAFPTQALHMVLAAYASVAALVLGVHAWRLRAGAGDPAFHRAGAKIALAVGAIALPLQIASGHLAGEHLGHHQPAKLAAMESLFHSRDAAPVAIGGWPDEARGELRYAIELPYGLSILATGDPDGHVVGLDEVPRADWPPVPVVHVSFQIMVGAGMAMLSIFGAGAFLWWRRGGFWTSPRFLRIAALASPLGLVAVEAGWTVTEVGRQPFVVHGILRTADAVTPMPGLVVPLVVFTLLYVVLGLIVIAMLRAHVFAADGPPSSKGEGALPAHA